MQVSHPKDLPQLAQKPVISRYIAPRPAKPVRSERLQVLLRILLAFHRRICLVPAWLVLKHLSGKQPGTQPILQVWIRILLAFHICLGLRVLVLQDTAAFSAFLRPIPCVFKFFINSSLCLVLMT